MAALVPAALAGAAALALALHGAQQLGAATASTGAAALIARTLAEPPPDAAAFRTIAAYVAPRAQADGDMAADLAVLLAQANGRLLDGGDPAPGGPLNAEAQQAAAAALSVSPLEPRVWTTLAFTRAMADDLPGAAAAFEAAVRVAPRDTALAPRRLLLALGLWPHLSPERQALAQQQILLLWRTATDAPLLEELARDPQWRPVVQAALSHEPEAHPWLNSLSASAAATADSPD